MKLKENVTIERDNAGYTLVCGGSRKSVPSPQTYILESLQKKEEDNSELQQLIMKTEKINQAAAGFTLADFILEYSDFLEIVDEKFMID